MANDTVYVATVSEVIGRNVRARREQRGWTQTDLGQRMGDYLGGEWTRQQVFTAEKGVRVFTAAEVAALAHMLGVLPGQLFEPQPSEDGGPLAVSTADGKSISAAWLTTGAGSTGATAASIRELEVALIGVMQTSAQLDQISTNVTELVRRVNDAVRGIRGGTTDA